MNNFVPVEELRAEPESAVLLDSPHSGSHYPADFRHSCERALLAATEDAFVDTLFGGAPLAGATLLRARFARSYIDPNRACDDVDPLLFAAPTRAGGGSAKSQLGMSLVWRLVEGRQIYAQPLSAQEVEHRIATCWRPYHDVVARAWRRVTAAHGFGIHLNCHSMPSASPLYGPPPRDVMPHDFVLGDRDGSTASPRLTRHVAEFLRRRGYAVGVNDPFKGVELIRRTGEPALLRHALQIEVNKRLYMDEATRLPHGGFAEVQADLQALVAALVSLTRADVLAL